MTTPTPRTDAEESARILFDECQRLKRDLAAAQAELAQAQEALADSRKRVRELEEDRIIRQSPNDASYRAMARRFAGWRFPDDFGPDGAISFKRPVADSFGNLFWPVGTNLLTVDQAEAMFRYCVPTVPQDSEFHPDWSMLEAARESLREHMALLKEAQEARQAAKERVKALVNERRDAKRWERAYDAARVDQEMAENRAQRAEALAAQNARDAEHGRILMRYIDRLNDPTPEDSLEKIVGEMSKDVLAAIDAAKGKP